MSCVLEALNSLTNKPSVAPPKPIPSHKEQIDSITPQNVKLTHYASGLGCACKMKAPALMEVLHSIQKSNLPSPNLLVGYDKADDASVYKLTDDLAIVNTTDFFPPIVDDPKEYGMIVAANALSDIYAMGGKPLTALSVTTFPTSKLPLSIMREIIQGAEEVTSKAGCTIAGGHTLDIGEIIFGLAVTGIVNPNYFKKNGSTDIKNNSVIILTKPIGTGIVTTLLKKEKISKSDDNVNDVFQSMKTLNDKASQIFCNENNNKHVYALTDVTGYGLAGHLSELVSSSVNYDEKTGENIDVVVADINVEKVQYFKKSVECLTKYGTLGVPGGAIGNAVYAGSETIATDKQKCSLRWCLGNKKETEHIKCLVVDPQTSGGLLAVVDKSHADNILAELRDSGVNASIIGKVMRFDGEEAHQFAHSKYVVFTDNDTEENYLKNIDNSMNSFDILSYLMKNNNGTGDKSGSSDKNEGMGQTSIAFEQTLVASPTGPRMKTIFIRNTTIGSGDDILGKKLLLAHLAKLSQRDNLGNVKRLVFMNTGVRIPLGLEDSRYVPILLKLEEKGIDICTCGTCIDHYAYSQSSLICGRVSSADENINIMTNPNEDCITLC